MKTYSILFLTFLFSTYNYSQKIEIVDLVSRIKVNQQEIKIRFMVTFFCKKAVRLFVVDGLKDGSRVQDFLTNTIPRVKIHQGN